MKKLYAIIAILFAVTLVANAAPNTNSHKEATGTFYYTVEPPLVITTNNGSVDLGAVCPGCTVNFTDSRCVQWTITGGASCNVLVNITNTTPPESGVTIITETDYSDDSQGPGVWEAVWDEHADGTGGIFHIGTNDLQYRVCALSMSADNSAAAGTNLMDVFTITGDYSNDVAPHL
ncbi:MAG: hypothetical protein ABSG15_07465 [FCB group bacterium]|jgi:hypothetical protein